LGRFGLKCQAVNCHAEIADANTSADEDGNLDNEGWNLAHDGLPRSEFVDEPMLPTQCLRTRGCNVEVLPDLPDLPDFGGQFLVDVA
jgi:hypothetical protein